MITVPTRYDGQTEGRRTDGRHTVA